MRVTPGLVPGVFVSARAFFVLAALCVARVAAQECAPSGPLQPVRVDYVIDGDTFALKDGRHVRLIGINAPETGHGDRSGEPLGAAAKGELAKLLPRGSMTYLQLGDEPRDRYGRQLAHVFRSEAGARVERFESVEATLLRDGLAQHIAIPPNTDFADCLAAAERTARTAGRGLWREAYFAPRDARTLSVADAGYRRVRVKIEAVHRDRHGWWLETGGPLVLRLDDRDAAGFTVKPKDWIGKTLVVRGWVRDRSADKSVRQRGFAPLLLPLQHPVMVESGSPP